MKPWSLVLVLAVTLPLIVGVAGLPVHDAPDAPIHTHVGARYIERGVRETGMKNLVTAVLLNYRGFDTFIEVVVIFTALAALLALPRGGPPVGEHVAEGHGASGRAGAASGDAPPASADASPASGDAPPASVDGAPTGPAASSAVPVTPVVSFVVRLLAPFIAMFALVMLFRGHITPGGGFQAAAVFGALFIALGLVFGNARAARLVPLGARPWLQAAAPVTFALVAWFGWRLTGAFLGVPVDDHAVQEGMSLALEVGIGLGGGVVLARLFLLMEA